MEDTTVPLLGQTADPDMKWAFEAVSQTTPTTTSTTKPTNPSTTTTNTTTSPSYMPSNPLLASIFQREMNHALSLKIMFTTTLEGDDEENEDLLRLETLDVEGRPMKARYSFHGTDDDEVDVDKNEPLIAIGRNPHWVLVHVDRTKKIGLVPATYVVFTDT
jgi:hypothetical protein